MGGWGRGMSDMLTWLIQLVNWLTSSKLSRKRRRLANKSNNIHLWEMLSYKQHLTYNVQKINFLDVHGNVYIYILRWMLGLSKNFQNGQSVCPLKAKTYHTHRHNWRTLCCHSNKDTTSNTHHHHHHHMCTSAKHMQACIVQVCVYLRACVCMCTSLCTCVYVCMWPSATNTQRMSYLDLSG